jgi:hypothetical protein
MNPSATIQPPNSVARAWQSGTASLISRQDSRIKWSIRHRIIFAFCAILFVMLLMGAITYTQSHAIDKRTEAAQNSSVPGLYYSTSIATAITENFALIQQYLATQDKTSRRVLESQIRTKKASIDDLML